jgi:hypothetical protein
VLDKTIGDVLIASATVVIARSPDPRVGTTRQSHALLDSNLSWGYHASMAKDQSGVTRHTRIARCLQCATLVSLTWMLVLSTVSCAQSQTRDPYEILEQHYRTIGLMDSSAEWKTYYAEGILIINNLGTESRFKEWKENPMRMRLENIGLGYHTTYGDNGEYIWRKELSGDLVLDKDSASLRRHKEELLRSQFEHLNPESKEHSLFYAGTSLIDSTLCHAVEITSTLTIDTTIMFIDTATNYLKARFARSNGNNMEEYYSDFRTIGGIVRPFRDSTVIAGIASSVTRITTVFVFDLVPPDSVFEPTTDTIADVLIE